MTLESVPPLPGENALGHSHLFRHDRLAFLRGAAEVGDVTRMRFMHRRALVVSSPEAAHEILVEQARKFEKSPGLRLGLHDLAGQGLFTSEGELWQRQRRLMSPLFHAGALAGYAKTMNDVTHRALERLRDGATVDLASEMTRITMGVVGATLFGADTFDKADELGHARHGLLGNDPGWRIFQERPLHQGRNSRGDCKAEGRRCRLHGWAHSHDIFSAPVRVVRGRRLC